MRRGSRRPRITEVAAAASGGEMIAPSVSPAAQAKELFDGIHG